jgi:hypothetical protein
MTLEVFVLADNHIAKESCVEHVNGLLTAGRAPNVFACDEEKRMCAAVRPFAEMGLRQHSPCGTAQQIGSCSNFHTFNTAAAPVKLRHIPL